MSGSVRALLAAAAVALAVVVSAGATSQPATKAELKAVSAKVNAVAVQAKQQKRWNAATAARIGQVEQKLVEQQKQIEALATSYICTTALQSDVNEGIINVFNAMFGNPPIEISLDDRGACAKIGVARG